jgi:hypothetical protein
MILKFHIIAVAALVLAFVVPEAAITGPYDPGFGPVEPVAPLLGQNAGSAPVVEARVTRRVQRRTVRRTTVRRNTNVRVNRNTNIRVRRATTVRVARRPVRRWVRHPYYGRRVAGVALGTIIVVSARAVPLVPRSDLCWYWSNSSMTRGYWDYCVEP